MRDVPDAEHELEGLWAEVFGEPPSISAPPALLVQVLVTALPPAPPYAPATLQAPSRRVADADPSGPVYPSRAAG